MSLGLLAKCGVRLGDLNGAMRGASVGVRRGTAGCSDGVIAGRAGFESPVPALNERRNMTL